MGIRDTPNNIVRAMYAKGAKMSDEIDYRIAAEEIFKDCMPLIESVITKKAKGVLKALNNQIKEKESRILILESFARGVISDGGASDNLKAGARKLLDNDRE